MAAEHDATLAAVFAAEAVDVVVVGAGPAGMSAATLAARAGLSVVLLDEQDAVGGQIYRAIGHADARRKEILGPDYAAGSAIAEAFARSGARHVAHASVWQVTRERSVHYLKDGKVGSFDARRVILATGALERPFPIPGWTLPGVLTAGAAQILLKSAGEVPAEAPVLAGCGPLLYLLGWQYVRAGVPIRALVDTTRHEDRWRAKKHLLSALRAWPFLSKGLQLIRTLRAAGVPIYEAADDLQIESKRDSEGTDGTERAAALRFTTQGRAHRVEANVILLHQGVVPNTQFTLSLRAQHHWDAAQLCFAPTTDAWGELDVPGIFVAGDGGGIGGAQAAAEQGALSALQVACQLGAIDAAALEREAAPHRRALADVLRIRPFLDSLYRPRDANRIPSNDVVVCRCEEVTAGDVRGFVELGCMGPNQAKSFGRCGMGPCQGRMCGLTVTEIIADARKVSPGEVGYYRIRPPIKPLTLGELAGE
ncbi:FAD-dependent oxidoreductase [Paraburkholderia sabiae]|uniref:FAD-dependent oxidoreductase n=1 Tax=Paraburkholderia sabiae TaxID=273251 RepID=A0ABU9Q6W1_9BURK|nr:FAD-dependent oxidoreductase [Paraburkholderia sabiae]WJZ78843.1 FAD-dependent oxidoreductase [Paraburkholderia sabiae]CAD6512814.1 Hydrogen cyanide synthase subunit HcnB [Paraburkholderia sabiae]